MTDTKHEIVAATTVQYLDRPQTELHPLVQMAQKMTGEITVDTMRELMNLQREYEAGEAKKAFTRAMVKLKAEMPSVLNKDKDIGFEKKDKSAMVQYRHTTLAHAIDTVTPHLAKHGFSLSWSATNAERFVTTTCRLTHEAGHSEEMSLSAGPDQSGNKNSIQAIGSTITYLQRYSALALLGIATADMKDPTNEPEKQDKSQLVDSRLNLAAVSALQKIGINLKQAEDHVQANVKDWTAADLDSLRKLIRKTKDEKQPAENTEIEK